MPNGAAHPCTDEGTGASLFARERGAGEPILLLHAFPLDARMWEPVAQRLASTHRVIAPDLPGFGRSSGGPAFGSLDQHADAIAALLDERGVVRATVVGVSMGGYIALALAKRHPERLLRLALVDARTAADSPEARAGRAQNIEVVKQQGVPALLERMLPKLLRANAAPSLVNCIRQMGGEQLAPGIIAALEAMRDRPDSTAVLAGIAVTTAIIVGAHDALLTVAEAREMADTSDYAYVEVIEEAGHLSPCEAPEAVARAITRLVERTA